MKQTSASTCALLFLSLQATGQDPDPVALLDSYASEIIPAWEVPGLALAVVSGGELVLAKGYGVTELGASTAVDANTLFAIASTTKAMTVALLGTQVDAGELAWDDRVSLHLPGFELADPFVTREVTIRDLLTHRTGLAYAEGLWYGSDRTRSEILERVALIPSAYSLRDGFIYQNIMYLAAGQLSAQVAGVSWEQLIDERLFGPLDMPRSTPTTSAAQLISNVARPHDRVGGEILVIENEIGDALAPAGAVWSSVQEMSHWMRMLLAGGEWSGERVLSEASVAEMFAPQTVIRGGGAYPYLHMLEPHWNTYGLGWFQLDYNGRAVSFHTGSIDGMSAIVGLVPDEGLGIVVLANLDHAELRHALLWKTLDLFAGELEGRDWSAELLPFYAERASEQEQERKQRDAARQPGTEPSLALKEFVGSYRNELSIDARVSLQGAELRLVLGPRLAGKLEHWHHDTFLLRFDRRWQGDRLISFRLDDAGEVASLESSGAVFAREAE